MISVNCIWFRHDLRVHANPALDAARKKNEPTLAVYAVTPATWEAHDWSQAKVHFVKAELARLTAELHTLNIPLHILELQTFAELPEAFKGFFKQHQVTDLYVNRHYGLDERRCETAIQKNTSVQWHFFNGNWLLAPEKALNQQGKPYHVFTAYKRHVLSQLPPYFESTLGESEATQKLQAFCKNGLADYPSQRDFPNLEGTSRLSHYLAQGILS